MGRNSAYQVRKYSMQAECTKIYDGVMQSATESRNLLRSHAMYCKVSKNFISYFVGLLIRNQYDPVVESTGV